MSGPRQSLEWKWALAAGGAITLLSLLPQIHFWIIRGQHWNGMYSMQQGDETYYSAYINALIDGRPRRNDPFIGQDNHRLAPLSESLFSIQFVPPYAIASFASLLGLSASTTFIFLIGVIGFTASVSVYWLLFSITRDSKVAAVGAVFVLCFGTIAAGQGWVGLILKPDARFSGLLFLRRYLPSVPFPLVFVFCALVWNSLTTRSRRKSFICALLGGLTLSVLIFSYFYLWTATFAWFISIACLWLVFRISDRFWCGRVFVIVAAPVMVAAVAYGYLLSLLPPALGKIQVLTLSRMPDLFRVPELLGALVLVVLIVELRRGRLQINDPRSIAAIAFSLLPFVVFNQQVITGRSIQPYHYEIFIANYAVLVAMVITVNLRRPAISGRVLITTAVVCLLWGALEVNQSFLTRPTFDSNNDEMVPVLKRLKDFAQSDGTWESLSNRGRTSTAVFSPTYGISRLLPTWAPQGSLLAPGSAPFQSLPEVERKERLYSHLYYSGKDTEYYRELLNDKNEDIYFSYYARSTVFGPERVLSLFADDFRPITSDEIEAEVRAYDLFVREFSLRQVHERPITYLIAAEATVFDFSRVDRWYERDSGQRVGAYYLYRLRPR